MVEIVGPLHWIQLALFVLIAGWVFLLARRLWGRGTFRVVELIEALDACKDNDEKHDLVARLIETEARESYVGCLLVTGMKEDLTSVDELEFDLRCQLQDQTPRLKVLGRVATGLGLLGAVTQVLWLFGGSHGLLGLQAGLPGRVATAAAMLSLALGLGSALLSRVGVRALAPSIQSIVRAMRRVRLEMKEAGALSCYLRTPSTD